MDIANAVEQQRTKFTQGEEHGEADDVRRIPKKYCCIDMTITLIHMRSKIVACCQMH